MTIFSKAIPFRLEFLGAIYHVKSRGDRREVIFEDDADCEAFLNGLNVALTRFDDEMQLTMARTA